MPLLIILGIILGFVILNYAVFRPLEKKAEQKRRARVFYKECPEALLETLHLDYMGDDGHFITPGEEEAEKIAMLFKVDMDAMRTAITLLSTGRALILVSDHERWSAKFRHLIAIRRDNKELFFELSEPFSVCTTSDW